MTISTGSRAVRTAAHQTRLDSNARQPQTTTAKIMSTAAATGKKKASKGKANSSVPTTTTTSPREIYGGDQKGGSKSAKTTTTATSSSQPAAEADKIPSAGYLVSCDVPTKQFIQYLNELKPVDKKFIIEDLDATHLLVKHKARAEIERKVEEFFDSNVFSPVERVGEEFDTS